MIVYSCNCLVESVVDSPACASKRNEYVTCKKIGENDMEPTFKTMKEKHQTVGNTKQAGSKHKADISPRPNQNTSMHLNIPGTPEE